MKLRTILTCLVLLAASSAFSEQLTADGVTTQTVYDANGNPIGTSIGTITIGFNVYDREAYNAAAKAAALNSDIVDLDLSLCKGYLARVPSVMLQKRKIVRAQKACARVAARDTFKLKPLGQIAASAD